MSFSTIVGIAQGSYWVINKVYNLGILLVYGKQETDMEKLCRELIDVKQELTKLKDSEEKREKLS